MSENHMHLIPNDLGSEVWEMEMGTQSQKGAIKCSAT